MIQGRLDIKMRHPKPTHKQRIGRLIRKAADVLEDRNWRRQATGHQDTAMCMVGAIMFTELGEISLIGVNNRLCDEAVREMGTWLQKNKLGFSVPQFNDSVVVDKEEAISYMRKFADEYDPQWP